MLSVDTNKSSGVYTCQTCNSLFTCLDYYQKHRRQHAEAEGVKLLTCSHCTYVSDNGFHYNWHIMSHASSPPHRCDVCAPNHQQQFSLTNNNKHFFGAGHDGSNHSNHDNNSGASNGIDQDPDGLLNQRISNTLISSDGKRRSIATETDDDLILLSQIYSPSTNSTSTSSLTTTTTTSSTSMNNKTLRREDIYHNLETIDARHLLDGPDALDEPDDNATIIQEEESATEDDDSDDDEDDETDEETDVDEPSGSFTYDLNQQQPQQTNCDMNDTMLHHQQQDYYGIDEDGIDEDDEDEDDGENQDLEHIQYQEQNFSHIQQFDPNQQMVPNGYSESTGGGDQIINELVDGQAEITGYEEEEEEEEDDDDDDDDDEDGTNKNNCDINIQQQHHQQPFQQQQQQQGSATDVYDFNSDEDLDHQHQHLNVSSKSSLSPAAAVTSSSSSSSSSSTTTPFNTSTTAALTNIHQLQPFINTSSQGLPIAGQQQNQQQQQQQPQHIQPTFLTHTMNANFIFPGASTGPLLGQQNATAPNPGPTLFNPGAFTTNGSTIRLVSIQPFQNNGNSQQQPQPTTATTFLQAQTNGTSSNSSSSLSLPSAQSNTINSTTTSNSQPHQVSSGLVFARKSPKKLPSTNTVNNKSNNNTTSCNGLITSTTSNNSTSIGNGVTTIIRPSDYKPVKGKGKGNRKPRISFISVINGITVGADGIRRKFHCSHCGNGKSFKTKSHLQRHMLTHTGEKPYQCQECGAKFNQSSSLRNHIIAIHTKKFPHTCTICGKGFLMPAVLQKHIQTTGHQSAITAPITLTPSSIKSTTDDSLNSENQKQKISGDIPSLSMQYSDSNNSDFHVNDDSTSAIEGDSQDHNFHHNKNHKDDDDDDDDNDDDDDDDDYEDNLVIDYKAEGPEPHELEHSSSSSFHHHQNATSNSVSTLNLSSTIMPITASGGHSQPQTSSQSNLFFILTNSTPS